MLYSNLPLNLFVAIQNISNRLWDSFLSFPISSGFSYLYNSTQSNLHKGLWLAVDFCSAEDSQGHSTTKTFLSISQGTTQTTFCQEY